MYLAGAMLLCTALAWWQCSATPSPRSGAVHVHHQFSQPTLYSHPVELEIRGYDSNGMTMCWMDVERELVEDQCYGEMTATRRIDS
jgi:hypothetical protein